MKIYFVPVCSLSSSFGMARTLLVAALMLVAPQGQGQFAPGPNPILEP